jgi:hypothetical protein
MNSRLTRRALSSLVAEEALLRALGSSNGGGSILPPLPSATEIVYVNKGGNDATGTGTIIQPFLTPTKALASITDASAVKPYTVQMGPGTYADALALKSFVTFFGEDPLVPVIFSGVFSIAAGFANNGYTGFTNILITSAQAIAWGAVAGGAFRFMACGVNIFAVSGFAGGVPSQLFSDDTTFTSLAAQDCNVITKRTDWTAGPNIFTAAGIACSWQSRSDAFSTVSNLEVVASGAFAASFVGIGTQLGDQLVLNGANVVYSGTAGAIPPITSRLAGAPPPVLLSFGNSIGYAPTTAAANWSGVAPGAVSDPNVSGNSALDRLATAVRGLLGAPIP